MGARARRPHLKLDVRPPRILKCNLDFIDSIMAEEVNGETGIPTEVVISLSGRPGARKSTLGVQMLNAFGFNPGCVTHHYDMEQGKYRTSKMYERLRVTHIHDVFTQEEIQGPKILDKIYADAEKLEEENKTLVALIDSFNYLCVNEDSNKEKKEIAERLKTEREHHKNLIIITINHLTKTGAVGGPAEVQQRPDVLLSLELKHGFVRLRHPKNRIQAPGAPEEIKLHDPGHGLVISNEPDFLSSLPIVQWGREIWKKYNKKGKSDDKQAR